MIITPPPAQFDGRFPEFYERYVEPNLPSPDSVVAFDALLRRYLSAADPVHVACRLSEPFDIWCAGTIVAAVAQQAASKI